MKNLRIIWNSQDNKMFSDSQHGSKELKCELFGFHWIPAWSAFVCLQLVLEF